jgi:hypothetical protein
VTSVNPVDRDRGLRLVGAVTSAVAAVSLVGIGATTALAAGQTRHQDALKAARADPAGGAESAAVGSVSAAGDSAPTPRTTSPKRKPAKGTASRSRRATDPANTGTKATGATAARATRPSSTPKPSRPSTGTSPQPPAVPSTGS